MEENTTLWISKEASQKLSELAKKSRFSKKELVESFIETLYEKVQEILKTSKNGNYLLLGEPKVVEYGILFPCAVVQFVSGKIEIPMSLSEKEADKLVQNEIKKKFEEMSQNE